MHQALAGDGSAGHRGAPVPPGPSWVHCLPAVTRGLSRDGRRRLAGPTHHVRAEQLTGPDRERAWAVITEQSSSFLGYEKSIDRELPVLRLLPVAPGAET